MDKIRKLKEIIKNESVKHEKIGSFQRMIETLFDIVYQKPDSISDDESSTVFISIDRKLYDKKSKDKRIHGLTRVFLDIIINNRESLLKKNGYTVQTTSKDISNEVKYSIDKEFGDLGIRQYYSIEQDYDGAVVTLSRAENSYTVRVEHTLLVTPILAIVSRMLNKHYFYTVQNDELSALLKAMNTLSRTIILLQELSIEYQEKLIVKYHARLEEFLWRIDNLGTEEGLEDLVRAAKPFYVILVNSIEEYHSEFVALINPILGELLVTHSEKVEKRNQDILWHLERLQERKQL